MKRLVSATSITSNKKDGEADEEIDEDLPEISFSRILAYNKPEIGYIISKICAGMVSCLNLNWESVKIQFLVKFQS